jgi:membrane protease YdiL (CAAX protease family)
VLVQLLVVGLPEEVFYRGLLQPRLQLVLPPRLRILGAPFGWATVVTSLLFALGHYLVDFAPGRLAVFFPSLLFGWIRNRTGSVAAGAVFHGLSNVLLAILNRAYVG